MVVWSPSGQLNEHRAIMVLLQVYCFLPLDWRYSLFILFCLIVAFEGYPWRQGKKAPRGNEAKGDRTHQGKPESHRRQVNLSKAWGEKCFTLAFSLANVCTSLGLQKRFMNSKERSIGINREALDQQMKEKAEAASREKEEKLEEGVFCFHPAGIIWLHFSVALTSYHTGCVFRVLFTLITALPHQPKNWMNSLNAWTAKQRTKMLQWRNPSRI